MATTTTPAEGAEETALPTPEFRRLQVSPLPPTPVLATRSHSPSYSCSSASRNKRLRRTLTPLSPRAPPVSPTSPARPQQHRANNPKAPSSATTTEIEGRSSWRDDDVGDGDAVEDADTWEPLLDELAEALPPSLADFPGALPLPLQTSSFRHLPKQNKRQNQKTSDHLPCSAAKLSTKNFRVVANKALKAQL